MLSAMFSFRQKYRQAVRERPFPAEWLRVIEKNVPYFRLLTPEEVQKVLGRVPLRYARCFAFAKPVSLRSAASAPGIVGRETPPPE